MSYVALFPNYRGLLCQLIVFTEVPLFNSFDRGELDCEIWPKTRYITLIMWPTTHFDALIHFGVNNQCHERMDGQTDRQNCALKTKPDKTKAFFTRPLGHIRPILRLSLDPPWACKVGQFITTIIIVKH